MVGRCISYWNSSVLGDMFGFRGVDCWITLFFVAISPPQRRTCPRNPRARLPPKWRAANGPLWCRKSPRPKSTWINRGSVQKLKKVDGTVPYLLVYKHPLLTYLSGICAIYFDLKVYDTNPKNAPLMGNPSWMTIRRTTLDQKKPRIDAGLEKFFPWNVAMLGISM